MLGGPRAFLKQLHYFISSFFPPVTDGNSVRGSSCGEEGDFAVHASVYGKVQAESSVNPKDQRRKEGERCFFLPGLGCPATYVDYVPYISLSRLGVSSLGTSNMTAFT
jgi:hypothetical protein